MLLPGYVGEFGDEIGMSSIGVQSIMPTSKISGRDNKRKPDGDHDTDDAAPKSNHEPPSPPSAGTGRLLDKVV